MKDIIQYSLSIPILRGQIMNHINKTTKKVNAWQQLVLQEYIDVVKSATLRLGEIDKSMIQAKSQWELSPIIDSLSALRGVDTLSAMTILAELGDLTRFSLVTIAILGQTPSSPIPT